MFQRTLTFETQDIKGGDVTLLLCFQAPKPDQMFKSQFPVAWRVVTFSDKGHQTMTATYKSQLMFARTQMEDGNIVSPGTWREIDPGEVTTLKQDGEGSYYFTIPTTADLKKQSITAINAAGSLQDIAVGFVTNNEPNPAVLFRNVGNTSSVVAIFTPVLMAYITAQYKNNSVLEGAIESLQPIWTQDLSDLKESTTWSLNRNTSGEYTITAKSSLAATITQIPKHLKILRAWLCPVLSEKREDDPDSQEILDDLEIITGNLRKNRYKMKVILKGLNSRFDITIPDGTSFCQTQEDFQQAIARAEIKYRSIVDVEGVISLGDFERIKQWVAFDRFSEAYITA